MYVPPGVALQEFLGGNPQALFQAQDIIGGKNEGGFTAARGKAGDARVAAETKAALGGELHGAHYLQIQVNHTKLLHFVTFFLLYQKLRKFPGVNHLNTRKKVGKREFLSYLEGEDGR